MYVPLLLVFSSMLHAAVFIDDGIEAVRGQFSNVVKIAYYEIQNGQEKPTFLVCTGTLIAPNIVLTAAHCANKNSNVILRVSSPGDVEGETKNGTRVSRNFISNTYISLAAEQKKRAEYFSDTKYFTSPPEARKAYRNSFVASEDKVSEFDIAFLELEQDLKLSVKKFPRIGCRTSLTPNSEVQIAGYGFKAMTNSRSMHNLNGQLNYGSNFIENLPSIGSLYKLNRKEGKQLINTGDSGGPLFGKSETDMVYGVVSTKLEDDEKRNAQSTFANLSSINSHQVYGELLERADIPKTLRTILAECQE